MRDYVELVKALRYCATADGCLKCHRKNFLDDCSLIAITDAADAIEELLAVCRDIAAFVIHYADDDEVSAEVLCRKLHKIGVVEKDGAWWTLADMPKEVE